MDPAFPTQLLTDSATADEFKPLIVDSVDHKFVLFATTHADNSGTMYVRLVSAEYGPSRGGLEFIVCGRLCTVLHSIFVGATNIIRWSDPSTGLFDATAVYYINVDLRRVITNVDELLAYKNAIKELLIHLPCEYLKGDYNINDLLIRRPNVGMSYLVSEFMEENTTGGRALVPGCTYITCAESARYAWD